MKEETKNYLMNDAASDFPVDEIKQLCLQAGAAIIRVYNQFESSQISYKSDDSPLTDADLESNEIMIAGLKKMFPRVPVISEESFLPEYAVRKKYSSFWLLDPLDGTQGFVRKTGEFAINLALIYSNEVIAGCIYIPMQQKFCYAIKGSGAFEHFNGTTNAMKVSEFYKNQSGLRVLQSRHHKDPETAAWVNRLIDPELLTTGGSLKFLDIASGKADYYPRMSRIMEWDTAAGHIIIEEAGGSFRKASDHSIITYNTPKLLNPAFIASGKILDL
jgi:3'(2'), 5'-bisphosphate nucleotidase